MNFKSLHKGTNYLEIQKITRTLHPHLGEKWKQVRKRQFKKLLNSNLKNWKMNEIKYK